MNPLIVTSTHMSLFSMFPQKTKVAASSLSSPRNWSPYLLLWFRTTVRGDPDVCLRL